MYPGGNLQHSGSGERRSSYQHYSSSQVNNEKPVVQREQEEQSQTWGQPSSALPSLYPSNTNFDGNFSSANRLASSSSSLFDRNNAILQDNYGAGGSSSYQQQSYRSTKQSAIPLATTVGQQSNASSSYSKISNLTSQPGIQHFHDVPYYHGFKFQTIPGSFFALMRIELI